MDFNLVDCGHQYDFNSNYRRHTWSIMRVTAGKARGHNLTVPLGISDLRPSQDQVREAIFNILGDFITNKDVLDLYAGTGALGIEALSRGCRTCDFVDRSKDAAKAIHQNLKHTYLEGRSDVYTDLVEVYLNRLPHQNYDLILLDPPYIITPIQTLRLLPGFLNPSGIIVYLHNKRLSLTNAEFQDIVPEKLKILDSRRYGLTQATFLTLPNSQLAIAS